MAGRGKVEAEDKKPVANLLMLDKENNWVPAVDPLHFDKPSAGVGPGRTFGSAVAAADPTITVGLIPCAAGGSPIDAWKPGAYHAQTKSHPWDDAIKRAKLAQEKGVIKGILWHQGESDSSDKLAPAYAGKLKDLVLAFRKELNTDAPFIIGQLGEFEGKPWSEGYKHVDKAHRELPQQLPNVAFVSAKGLGHGGDKLHFDNNAQREFGKALRCGVFRVAQSATEAVVRRSAKEFHHRFAAVHDFDWTSDRAHVLFVRVDFERVADRLQEVRDGDGAFFRRRAAAIRLAEDAAAFDTAACDPRGEDAGIVIAAAARIDRLRAAEFAHPDDHRVVQTGPVLSGRGAVRPLADRLARPSPSRGHSCLGACPNFR